MAIDPADHRPNEETMKTFENITKNIRYALGHCNTTLNARSSTVHISDW